VTQPQKSKLCNVMFFFVLALAPAALFSDLSSASAGEAIVAPVPVQTASRADQTPIELAANFTAYPKATTQIVVNISVNVEQKGDFFVDQDDAGELFIKVEDLVALMLKFPQDRIVLIRNEKFVSLNAVQEITYTFNEKDLTVAILGKITEAKKTSFELYSLQPSPQNVYYPRETSAFLNYGLLYSYADPLGTRSLSVSNKIGAAAGNIFFVSDSLYTKTETNEHFVRLSSSATYERRNDLQWLVLGDQIATSGDLGSAVNMGGIGFSKVYHLDPYFITQPVFNLQGVTQYPSQAEIYMDGVLVGKQSIAPGAFELKNFYSYTGSHLVDVVLKDPFGNEQRISYPLYFNTQLLREGLHEYSYNVGFLREQYGVQSNEYGKPVFSAFHRYGVTSALNIGARAEGSDGIYNGGISVAFLVPHAGTFAVSFAESGGNGKNGSAGSFQQSYQVANFSTNLQLRGFSRDYAIVSFSTSTTSDMLKYQLSLGAGYTHNILGSIFLTYSESETYGALNARVTSISYSKALSRVTNLSASASSARTAETTYSFFVGLNFNLEKNYHAATQYSKTGNADTETVQIQKDQPVGEGLGYHASLNRSNTGAATSNSFNPFVQYNARYGIYSVDASIQNSSGNTSEIYNMSAAGSFVYAGGFFGASRPVNDSFSIVLVDTLPDAVVLNNGQEIGKTNSSGTMVVPTLYSYNQNEITLDVKNLPMDYSVSGVNVKLSPSQWSGSCVSFDAQRVRALTGNLFLRQGDKITSLEYVDIMIKVGEKEVSFPTGKGGEFYLENSLPEDPKSGVIDKQSCRAISERRKSGGNVIQPGTYRATVDLEGGKCEFSITFPKTENAISDIGEVLCVLP
jgi:outer membrane usher protein FimD/PapC